MKLISKEIRRTLPYMFPKIEKKYKCSAPISYWMITNDNRDQLSRKVLQHNVYHKSIDNIIVKIPGRGIEIDDILQFYKRGPF